MKKIFLFISLLFLLQTSFSQTSKKSWLVGGSATLSSTKEGDITNTIIDISPRIGYFVANNFAIGLNTTINATSDDGNKSSTNSFGPYFRYYFMNLGKNAKLFGNAQGIFGTENEGLGSSSLTGYGIAVGPSFFLNKCIALEFAVSYTSTKAGVESVKDNTTALNAGFQIHFGKN